MKKTELLLPVGNLEMFHAAIEGGADAIYLGSKQFNARGRAANFSLQQIQSLLQVTKRKGVRVYLTLNTVIKNEELKELFDFLYWIDHSDISAIIIQDWGVYQLVRKYFPKIEIHASTQMGNHNSLGADYSQKKGFAQVVMARELSLPELRTIVKKTQVPLEIFMHGALCYSFSGMCLFSSFLGGSGANRGLCAQPCRRIFDTGQNKKHLFSLKDNQAIDVLPELLEMGIASIKIEGRIKPAEYVYNVSRAYRMVIDHSDTEKAKSLLKYDMGREKTAYFLGGNVENAISENTSSGIFIGKLLKAKTGAIEISSTFELKLGNRIRVKDKNDKYQINIKLKEIEKLGPNQYRIAYSKSEVKKGDLIYLAGIQDKKFPNKLNETSQLKHAKMPGALKSKCFNSLKLQTPAKSKKQLLFVRIDQLSWLRKIHMNEFDYLLMNFDKKDWQALKADVPFLQKNARKIIIEFPKFIPEKDIAFYKELSQKLYRLGYKDFMLSHLSQKLLLPPKSFCHTNENVYLFNDAAIATVQEEKIRHYTYPLENDIENLLKGKDRNGILPLFYYPQLFYSRMPVKTVKEFEHVFIDDEGGKHQKVMKDGISIVYPEKPVSWLQQKQNLIKQGFSKFMLDLSHEKPSSNTFKRVIKHYSQAKQIQPSTSFNMKRLLK